MGACAANPFPYSSVDPAQRVDGSSEGLAEPQWHAARPPNVPPHWTTLFFRDYPKRPWESWVPFGPVYDNMPWELERTAHYLGAISPLLFNERDWVMIFAAGGLMFVHYLDLDSIYVMDHRASIGGIARAVDQGRIEDVCVETVFEGDLPCSAETYRYLTMWRTEKTSSGRNRWRELKQRGGDVDPAWLDDGCCIA